MLLPITLAWIILLQNNSVLGGDQSSSPQHQEAINTDFSKDVSPRALFWVSPTLNFQTFLFYLAFALIPFALGWVYWLYPPRKYYYQIPPDYVGYSVMNITSR